MSIFTSLKNKLLKADNDTELFSLDGEIKLCKVVDVYDGDTCKVVFKLKNKLYKWNVRMYGYDSPEMRVSKNNPNREIIKERAIEARDYLASLIKNDNQLVYIRCCDFDKYGRLLGVIFLKKDSKISVNRMMINNGYGSYYYGSTKISKV